MRVEQNDDLLYSTTGDIYDTAAGTVFGVCPITSSLVSPDPDSTGVYYIQLFAPRQYAKIKPPAIRTLETLASV